MGGFGPCLSLYHRGRTISATDYEGLPSSTKSRILQVGTIIAVFDDDRDREAARAALPSDPREIARPGGYDRFRRFLEQMRSPVA